MTIIFTDFYYMGHYFKEYTLGLPIVTDIDTLPKKAFLNNVIGHLNDSIRIKEELA